jgi:hypothetical protein
MAHAYNFRDLTGSTFGDLTVIGLAPRVNNCTRWFCRCSCGNVVAMAANNLKRNTSCKPCAALRRKKAYDTKSAEYTTWLYMKRRCYNDHRKEFARYGGKGVSVCEEWRNSFEAFYRDMGPRPSPLHSIDRIDPAGDYAPDNCRWILNSEQSKNRSYCIRVTHNGETKILKDWARTLGIPYNTLLSRYKRGAKTPEKLFAKPTHNHSVLI